MNIEEYKKKREEYEKKEHEQQEKIRKLIKRRFHDDSIKVIFLPLDIKCHPSVDFLICKDLKSIDDIDDHVGYIITPEGLQIPFIARVTRGNHGNIVFVFLNPQRDFYLSFFAGNLDNEHETPMEKDRAV